ARRLQAELHVLERLVAGGGGQRRREEADHPRQAQQALADRRYQIVVAAERADDGLQVPPGPVRPERGRTLGKDGLRNLIQVLADLLEDVGDAVDEGFQQADQRLFAGGAALLSAQQLLGVGGDRARLHIAQRDQRAPRQDEGDAGALRQRRVGVDQD